MNEMKLALEILSAIVLCVSVVASILSLYAEERETMLRLYFQGAIGMILGLVGLALSLAKQI